MRSSVTRRTVWLGRFRQRMKALPFETFEHKSIVVLGQACWLTPGMRMLRGMNDQCFATWRPGRSRAESG